MLRLPLVIVGFAVVALAVAHSLAVYVLDRDPAWLEAGTGNSIFELTSTALLGVSALAAAVLAVMEGGRRPSLAAIAAGLAVIFVIDAAALTDKAGAAGYAALVLVLGATFVLLWLFAPALGAGEWAVRAGLLLLALSVAVRAADPLISALDWEHGDVGYEAKVVVKHASELAGWMLVALGLVPAALSRSRERSRGAAAGAAESG
jgi:hypothetical protein